MSRDVSAKIEQYERFINDVLKEDLKQIDLSLQRVNAEIADLVQQKHTLKIVTDDALHPDGFKTQVNIGCNFFLQAKVTDASTVLLNIGLNHYIEFTIAEADRYLDVRIKAFEQKAEELRDKSAKTKAHIKLMLLGIGEMQGVM